MAKYVSYWARMGRTELMIDIDSERLHDAGGSREELITPHTAIQRSFQEASTSWRVCSSGSDFFEQELMKAETESQICQTVYNMM